MSDPLRLRDLERAAAAVRGCRHIALPAARPCAACIADAMADARRPAPLVYLSGPYAGCTDDEAMGWRREACRLLEAGGALGVVPGGDGPAPESAGAAAIVEGDKDDIDRCQAMLVNPWKPSEGTAMEALYAWERGLLVIVVGERVGHWIAYHSDLVVPSVAAGVSILLDGLDLAPMARRVDHIARKRRGALS